MSYLGQSGLKSTDLSMGQTQEMFKKPNSDLDQCNIGHNVKYTVAYMWTILSCFVLS